LEYVLLLAPTVSGKYSVPSETTHCCVVVTPGDGNEKHFPCHTQTAFNDGRLTMMSMVNVRISDARSIPAVRIPEEHRESFSNEEKERKKERKKKEWGQLYR